MEQQWVRLSQDTQTAERGQVDDRPVKMHKVLVDGEELIDHLRAQLVDRTRHLRWRICVRIERVYCRRQVFTPICIKGAVAQHRWGEI